jgi:radical SAM superfamily enzyme YgiQ (UPF0313 family)
MRILLIAPASGPWKGIGRGRLFNGKTFRFSMLSLLTVAAQSPPDATVVVVDEQVDPVPFDVPWDLVGITVMTAVAPRAYEIAARFRSQEVPVVLGGMHPTLMADEALAHADAVVAGDAEGVWPRVVEDARRGRLEGLYRSEGAPSLTGLAPPPRHLLRSRHYGTIHAVQATRGCPNRCAFCSVSAFHGGSFRCRPTEEVAAEVAALPGHFFILVDDSLTADRDYAAELFRLLAPLGKVWMSQSTLAAAEDEDLLDLASRAGCIGFFVGIETLSAANLDSVSKGFNRTEDYRSRIRALHDHGIGVEAGIVFGFDHDGPEVFKSTLEALEDLQVDMAQISILTPLPGTPHFEAMGARITDTDWGSYDYHHVVFEPKGMTARDLQAGHDWVTREFYRPGRILRRLARLSGSKKMNRALPFATAINWAYYGRTLRWGIRGWDPAAARGAAEARRLFGSPDFSQNAS